MAVNQDSRLFSVKMDICWIIFPMLVNLVLVWFMDVSHVPTKTAQPVMLNSTWLLPPTKNRVYVFQTLSVSYVDPIKFIMEQLKNVNVLPATPMSLILVFLNHLVKILTSLSIQRLKNASAEKDTLWTLKIFVKLPLVVTMLIWLHLDHVLVTMDILLLTKTASYSGAIMLSAKCTLSRFLIT